jgi:uncharacterized protein YjbI with pentapeptide repeats
MSNREYNFFNTVECSQTKQERIEMANQEHLDLLKQGSSAWNAWRAQHKEVRPDLSRANLSGANLSGANLSEANLRNANLSGANLSGANLSGVNLSRANLRNANLSEANLRNANLSSQDLSNKNLSGADLSSANLSGANLSGVNLRNANLSGQDLSNKNLSGADLSGADLSGANLSGQDLSNKNLSGADLSGANLSRTLLIGTNFTEATLTDCIIYRIAAWNVQLENAIQKNLIITQEDEATITVDNLKVAQFIYLMLNNKEIRDIIETITTKSVLILGRFTPERKAVLDALREALRQHNYLPILFDFEKPESRDITETISTLAHLARFVVADITQAKSIPQELERIVPDLPSVPVQPLLQARAKEYGMFEHFKKYPWVLEAYRYTTIDRLMASLKEYVIEPAERKAKELEKR